LVPPTIARLGSNGKTNRQCVERRSRSTHLSSDLLWIWRCCNICKSSFDLNLNCHNTKSLKMVCKPSTYGQSRNQKWSVKYIRIKKIKYHLNCHNTKSLKMVYKPSTYGQRRNQKWSVEDIRIKKIKYLNKKNFIFYSINFTFQQIQEHSDVDWQLPWCHYCIWYIKLIKYEKNKENKLVLLYINIWYDIYSDVIYLYLQFLEFQYSFERCLA
jgi:thiol-disulfide isomerase/thioredoxin